MNLGFKPMLACSKIPHLELIAYPVLASPKLDGIRCLAGNGVAFSRSMKRIPNDYVQQVFRELELHGLDGELMLDGDFNNVQSGIMSVHGRPKFYFNVFDCWDMEDAPFEDRLHEVSKRVAKLNSSFVRVVPHVMIPDCHTLSAYNKGNVAAGYEGTIVRDPEGPYKNGRSTMNQGWMLKIKEFSDAEATIIEVLELERNENEAFIGELGQTKRSHEKAGMVPGGTLGALLVDFHGESFKIGTGFNDEQRSHLWSIRETLPGKQVTFKYQELTKYGIPRFPVFKAIREEE